MSYLAEEHQQQILALGAEAERLYVEEGVEALSAWIRTLQEKEQTWAAVARSEINAVSGTQLSEQFVSNFRLGRSVEWKVHLYFAHNPIMSVPFSDGYTHFLIKLPQRMRPGHYLAYADIALQIAIPLALLCIVSWVLYRHVMKPLRQLEGATRKFSEGDYDVRVRNCLGARNDELTALADTFDQMAERTGRLIVNQRQLLSDLSHELRTPLTRLDMAVDCLEQGLHPQHSRARIRNEAAIMRELVEDTLTLAWLTTEAPQLNKDEFDLRELLDVICEDARFEFPDRQLITNELSRQANLMHSSQRAVGQALENVIRNALSHTPEHGAVDVALQESDNKFIVHIKDQGRGVPDEYLNDIFRPFFRLNKSRPDKPSDKMGCGKRGGFGLGLALAQRQITAVRGNIVAKNHYSGSLSGLEIIIEIPKA